MRLLSVGPKSWWRHTAGLAAIVLLAAACAPVSKLPEIDPKAAEAEAEKQREITVREQEKAINRVHRLSQRIRIANTELCEKTTHSLGARVYFTASSKKGFAKAKPAVYALADHAKFIQVPEGSAAWNSGIRQGDEILAIGDEDSPGEAKKIGRWFKDKFAEHNNKAEPYRIVVKRGEETRVLQVTPEKLCDYPFHVEDNDEANAFADGTRVIVTAGMIRFTNDDELALLLGHEMAHNTMEHQKKGQANQLAGALVGAVFGAILGVDLSGTGARIGGMAYSQEFEAEADYVGVYYAGRAGYDVSGAANLWRRIAARYPSSIHLAGTTHPSTAKRFIAIEKAAEEVATKRSRGEPLVPEIKDGDGAEEKPD